MTDLPLSPARDASRIRRAWPDILAVTWVVVAGIAIIVPALFNGIHLGPFDLLSQNGLLKKPGVSVHSTWVGDQISQMIPWTNLVWTQVHHGQLPLWNPYSGLGMPLAFNWQSAPFGLPALVGYLVPVQFAYTVGVAVTVVTAGTGGYFLGRVLHLGVLGSAMIGTAFELSGPFVGWLGWPHASVFSWTGWLFAATLFILRGRSRIRSIAFFSLVMALAVYAGQPEVLIVLAFALLVFLAVLLVRRAGERGPRSVLLPLVDLGIAVVAGGALAAPLALPGLQLFAGSIHSKTGGQQAVPSHDIAYLILQGFDGLPIAGSRMFGPTGPYYVGAYVGVIVVIMAVVAMVTRIRNAEIMAFTVVALLSGGIAFVPLLISIVDGLPAAGSIGWTRALLPMAFAFAVLAGFGIDALIRARRHQVWLLTGACFIAAGAVLAILFPLSVDSLPTLERRLRTDSFVWPAIEVLVGVVVFVLGLRALRRQPEGQDALPAGPVPASEILTPPNSEPVPSPGKVESEPVLLTKRQPRFSPGQWAGFVLLACETAALVVAGAPLWSSSATSFATTPAVSAFQQSVGSSEVGFGPNPSFCIGLGIQPNVNDVFNVQEFALYDPMVPKKYFTSFQDVTGRSAGYPIENEFCPAITSVAQARLYGLAYILESAGHPGPPGSKFDVHLGDEDLYRVPGSYPATLTPSIAHESQSIGQSPGVPAAVTHANPANWTVRTDSGAPGVLRLRITNVPGWHASIDGKPLALESFSGIMLQAHIPPGRHVVELNYWPMTFTLGLIIGACSLAGLSLALVMDCLRRRRPTSPSE
jgi:hypothetical protein